MNYIVRLQVIVEAVNQEEAVNSSHQLVERLTEASDVREAKMTSVEITSWKG
jgi:PII-like signaling protein